MVFILYQNPAPLKKGRGQIFKTPTPMGHKVFICAKRSVPSGVGVKF